MTILASAQIPEQYRLDAATTVQLPAPFRLSDSTNCPSWCVMHLGGEPGDTSILHVGDDAALLTTGHGEHTTVSVTEELPESVDRGVEPAAVRLQGAGDVAMTPDEALHLAGLLILAARRTVSR